MAVEFLLDGLSQLLEGPDVARVIAALRHDHLVWTALNNRELAEKALQVCGNQVRLWTPAVLSLVAMDETSVIGTLAVEAMKPLQAGLRQKAVRVYEETRKKGIGPVDFQDAGLLGLALRERRRLTGSWNGLTGELLTAPSGVRSVSPQTWKTPLACLAGFVPDFNDLVNALVTVDTGDAGLEWLVHILLTQAIDPDEQAQRIVQAIHGLEAAKQLDLLKALRLNGMLDVVEKTANLLVNSRPQQLERADAKEGENVTTAGLAEKAIHFQQTASFHQLGGNPAQAEQALRSAQEIVATLQAGLELQGGNVKKLASGEIWQNPATSSLPMAGAILKKMMKQVGLTINASQEEQTVSIQPGLKDSDPFLLLHDAETQNWLGNRDIAAEMAHQSSVEFIQLLQKSPLFIGGDFSFRVDLVKFVRSLANLGLNKDAALAVDSALQIDTANSELADLASRIHHTNGRLDRAKELATIAVHMRAGELPYLRHLAEVCEAVHDWQLACRYRKDCLGLPDGDMVEDQVAFARAALNAGDPDLASATCEQLLADNPDNGVVHGLLGLTRAAQNRDEEAVMHLNRATLVASDEPEWWLALAGHYLKLGDARTSLETLRAAVLAAPDLGDIHFNLGEMYLAERMNSEALPHLKRAVQLKPENWQVGFRLSRALHALGFLSEARQVIDGLRDHWSGNPEIGFEYAEIALAMDDVDAAVPAFDIATQSEAVHAEWLLIYAGILLNPRIRAARIDEATRYRHAEDLLRKALEIAPGDLWTTIQLAEALRKQSKFSEAYELYQQMVEMPEVVDKGYMWRIQHGFGLSAIGLGQGEAGITMLQEAAANRPDSLEVIKDLTMACLAAKLDQDAGETAERALEIAPDDHENLDWFAGIMVRLDRAERAAEALRCAIELSPNQSDLRVRFAQLAVENGNIQDAKDALSKLPELDGATPEVLRQAAYLHLRMQEPEAAIENLEKAVMLADQPEAVLLNDLAGVYAENGRIEDAIETVQKVPDTQQSVSMQVFYADLLAKQKRYQAAMLVIERALKQMLKSDLADDSHLAGIYARSAKWSRELGNVASAFEQVEKALEFEPDDLNLRFLATNLASALLQDEKAAKYALLPFEAVNRLDLEGVGQELAGLSGHLAFEAERFEDAQSLYDVCARINPEGVWAQSLQARLLARRGDIIRAGEVVDALLSNLEEASIEPGDATLWIAHAAFDAYRWQESFRLYDTLISKYSTEMRASLELSKAMVEAAETQQLCTELGVEVHAPGVDAHEEAFKARFEELFSPVKPLLTVEDAARWSQRSKLVSGLDAGGYLSETNAIQRAMDTAARMAALRVMKRIPEALREGQKFANEYPVIAQTALCLIEEDLPAGIEAAEKLVAKTPGHPMFLALYARLAQKAGDDGNALQAIEEAVRIWPEEANWHAWAGELAFRMEDIPLSLSHWKQASSLKPSNADFAVELGHVLSLNSEYCAAVETLTRAVEMAPEKAAAWLGLARAQKGSGQVDDAIRSALKAGELGDGMVEGFGYASQICQEIGQNDRALDYARAAYHANPGEARAIVNLSRVLTAQNKAIESLELISQSIDDLEPSRELFYERARLVFQIQGAEAAGALVDQLIEDFPEDPEALALHANVQVELGQLKVAERSAFRSLRLQPNQPGLALALARMNRKAGQLDQAVHLLGQAVAMDPRNVDVYLELGQAYIDRREHSLALQAFDQATRIAPKDSRGYYQSALIMKETKDYPGAEAMLEQAAKFAPEDLAIHRQLVGVMALNLIHKSQEASKAL